MARTREPYPSPSRKYRLVPVVLILLATPLDDARPQSANAGASQSASAKAAARKKKFEEDKRRLEGGREASSTEVPSEEDQTLFVSPAKATMLVGDSQPFCAFDIEGKALTGQAEWSISNSSVAELTVTGGPAITAKNPGAVTVRARFGGHYADASVNVSSADKLAPGTVRWSAPQIPGFTTQKIQPAVPSMGGPGIYIVESNNHGETLIRAFTDDGRQLWMRKMSGQVKETVPH